MPIQPINFEPLTWEQKNPGMVTALKTQDLIKSIMANIGSGMELKTKPATLEAKLKELQEKVPYMKSEEDLRKAQGDEIYQGDIPYKKMQTSVEPYKAIASYLSGVGYYNKASGGAALNSRMINSPVVQALIQENPEYAAQITDEIVNGPQQSQGGNNDALSAANAMVNNLSAGRNDPLPMSPTQIQKLDSTFGKQADSSINLATLEKKFPGITKIISGMRNKNVLQRGEGSQALQVGQEPGQLDPTQPSNYIPEKGSQDQPQDQSQDELIQQPGKKRIAITPEQLANVRKSVGENLYRKNTTGTIMNMQKYGAQLSSAFDKADKEMPYVSLYSGPGGKLKLANDMAASAKGNTPQDLIPFLNFTQNTAPVIAKEMGRTLGIQSTDAAYDQLKNIVNKDRWLSNPEQTMREYNDLKELFDKHIDKTLAKTSSETRNVLLNSGASAAQDFNDTKQSGMLRVQSPDGRIGSMSKKDFEKFSHKGFKVIGNG